MMDTNDEGAGATPAQDEFDVVDSLLGKADQEAEDSEADADETDGANEDQDEESPDEEADDHPDAEDDVGDTEEGDEERDDFEDDEEDFEGSDEDEEEDDSTDLAAGRLTAKEMATINASPELKKAFKGMQAALTVKTQALAKKSEAVEVEREEVLGAKEVLDDFIARLEDTKEGGGREQALIAMALDNPELFQRAFDAAADLVEDPEKRRAYEVARRREGEDADRDRRERELATSERKDFGRHANRLTRAAAVRLKLDEAGQELAAEFVADAIKTSVVAGGGYRIKDEAIVAAVKRAQQHVERLRRGARSEVEAEVRVRKGEDVRKAARNGKKRIVPNAGRPPVSTAPVSRLKNTAVSLDPVSSRVDELLAAVN